MPLYTFLANHRCDDQNGAPLRIVRCLVEKNPQSTLARGGSGNTPLHPDHPSPPVSAPPQRVPLPRVARGGGVPGHAGPDVAVLRQRDRQGAAAVLHVAALHSCALGSVRLPSFDREGRERANHRQVPLHLAVASYAPSTGLVSHLLELAPGARFTSRTTKGAPRCTWR